MFSSLLIFALLCICYHVAEANPEAKIVEDLTEAMNTISERSAAGLRTLQDKALAISNKAPALDEEMKS